MLAMVGVTVTGMGKAKGGKIATTGRTATMSGSAAAVSGTWARGCGWVDAGGTGGGAATCTGRR